MPNNHPPDDSNYLNIQAIAMACGCPYHRVRSYSEASGMTELMGGEELPGALGPRYPPASLPRWRTIIELHNAHVIKPNTASQVLRILWGQPTGVAAPEPVAAAPEPVAAASALVAAVQETAGSPQVLERIAEALETLVAVAERVLDGGKPQRTRWRKPRARR